jgi:SAM-dependent methyltransferase
MACFAGVLLVGAPYLPTLTPQVKAALQLADLKPGQTLLELGCGDGKVLLAAARQGNKAIGYELNPIIAAIAWLRTRKYRHLVKVKCVNFWRADWPPADAIFVFLLPRFMSKLDAKVARYDSAEIKLVSFAFKIPGKNIDKELDGVYLYKY